ncbi:MAG TPA: hypothetical protein VFQ53_28600 [Kofleriaceae bacterium]|nr:hypothetical protein [Kofleriaceae bacterium]
MNIVDDTTFKWILTILTGGLAGTWLIYDSISLIRSRNADRRDPLVRDRHFGYVIGILIGVVGVVGCLRFHGVV